MGKILIRSDWLYNCVMRLKTWHGGATGVQCEQFFYPKFIYMLP